MSPDTIHTTIVDTDALNTIVARHPQALEILQRFGLDTLILRKIPGVANDDHHLDRMR